MSFKPKRVSSSCVYLKPKLDQKSALPPKPRAESTKKTKILLSKLQLYEENIELKQLVNKTKTQLVRYKTQVRKRSEISLDNSPSLIKSLKSQLKASQDETKRLRMELNKHLKSSRDCRLKELESECESYAKECERLKNLLQEAYLQLSTSLAPFNITEKYLILSQKYKQLKKENKVLSSDYQTHNKKLNFTERLKLKLQEATAENQTLQEKVAALEKTVQKYKSKVKDLENLEAVSVKTIMRNIYKEGNLRRLKNKDLWYFLSDGKERLTSPEFKLALANKLKIKLTDFQYKFLEIELEGTDGIERSKFMEKLNKYHQGMLDYYTAKSSLMHLSLNAQLQRKTFNDLLEGISNSHKPFNKRELNLYLTKLRLAEVHAENITLFIFGNDNSLSPRTLSSRFQMCMDQWQVISLEEEKELDRKLREIIANNEQKFLKSAAEMDIDKSSIIQFEDFISLLEDLDLEVNDKLANYLRMLFYSDRFELDEVPYISFLRAYSNQ